VERWRRNLCGDIFLGAAGNLETRSPILTYYRVEHPRNLSSTKSGNFHCIKVESQIGTAVLALDKFTHRGGPFSVTTQENTGLLYKVFAQMISLLLQ
jgi:hypothetical protein